MQGVQPQLWLQSYALAGADGTAVAAWNGLAQGRNLAQATGANQPTLQTVNGKRVVRFDANDFMTVAAGAWMGPDVTIMAAVTVNNPAATRRIVGHPRYRAGHQAAAYPMFTIPGVTDDAPATDPAYTFSVGESSVITYRWSPSKLRMYLDGRLVSKSTDAAANANAATGNVFIGSNDGTGEFLFGDLAELLIFNSALSHDDRSWWEAALTKRKP